MFDPEEYREQSRAGWARMAGGWEERRDWLLEMTIPVADWLIEHLDPRPGQTVLELAAGTGDFALRLAERAGDDVRVLCTDFSPEMVDVGRRRSEARGVANVEHRVLDAERMDLADDSVDSAVCRYGYMLMADPAAALGETRRVLRDGGPLAFCVWTSPDRNPWAAVPARTLVERGHVPPPEPGTPGMFALGDPERIAELVRGAGFGDPQVDEIAFEYRYPDADAIWGSLIGLSGLHSRAVAQLSDDEREATRAAIVERAEPFRRDDGSYAIPASSWGVLAR